MDSALAESVTEHNRGVAGGCVCVEGMSSLRRPLGRRTS